MEAWQAPRCACSGSELAAPPVQPGPQLGQSAGLHAHRPRPTGRGGSHGPRTRTRPCWVTWGRAPYSCTEDAPTEGHDEDRDTGQETVDSSTQGHHVPFCSDLLSHHGAT